MSYVALYRKWRPDTFDEVKGQEHIVTTLKNQVKHNRVGHAYLFCGTRGTGKTTIAKLLAKTVNCENPQDGSPCNECESCKAIAEGRALNVIEIDAASNNGVDNIRQINSAVQYSPSQGKYLVYIIDEVHMLSGGAFNALLKTLEEPPEYVIFILATTEIHKIPVTIKSRCQRYDFHRITIETIADRLDELLKREQIPATRDALNLVARAADGSMRDALSILDQCISFHLGEELTADRVLDTIGAVDMDVYTRLFTSIIKYEPAQALAVIDEVIWQGKDLAQFVAEFMMFARNVLMLKISPEVATDLSTENREIAKKLGEDVPEERLLAMINVLQETGNKLSYATNKRIVLEVCVIKLCTPTMREQDYETLSERMALLEKSVEQKLSALAAHPPVVPAAAVQSEEDRPQLSPEELSEQVRANIRENYPPATYEDLMRLTKEWPQIVAETGQFARKYLMQARVNPAEAEGVLNLIFEDIPENKGAIDYFIGDGGLREQTGNHLHELEALIEAHMEKQVKLQAIKVTPGGKEDKRTRKFDLTKIRFDIEYKD